MSEIEWEEELEEVQKHSEHWYKMYSELKAENAELEEKYNRLNELKDFTFETYKGYGEIDVKELVRLFESRGYRLDDAYRENIKLQDQLTEAKEIIRDLLFHLGNTFIVSYTNKEESISKAEQFLKE